MGGIPGINFKTMGKIFSGSWNDKDAYFFLNGRTIYYFSLDTDPINTHVIYEFLVPLTFVFAYHEGSKLFATIDIQKTIHLLQFKSPKVRHWTAPLDRNPMCATFSKDGAYLLVGDKFGDLHRIYVPKDEDSNMPLQTKVISGCISMITDILHLGEFIAYSTRDEQIRIIEASRPYIIHQILLGHTSYVASIGNTTSGQLLSIGGDGKLLSWNMENTSPLQGLPLWSHESSPTSLLIQGSYVYAASGCSPIVYVCNIKDNATKMHVLEEFEIPSCSRLTALVGVNGGGILVMGQNKDGIYTAWYLQYQEKCQVAGVYNFKDACPADELAGDNMNTLLKKRRLEQTVTDGAPLCN